MAVASAGTTAGPVERTLAARLPGFPWDRLAPAAAYPGGIADLSIGTPVDPVPALIQDALAVAPGLRLVGIGPGTKRDRHPAQGLPRGRLTAVIVLFDQCPHDFAAAVLVGVPAPFHADRIDDQQPAPAFVVACTAGRFRRV